MSKKLKLFKQMNKKTKVRGSNAPFKSTTMKRIGKLLEKVQWVFLYFGFAYVGYQLGVILSNL